MKEAWTNDYIRIPFLDRGRTRAGADCWGLICILFSEMLNIELPRLDQYENTKDEYRPMMDAIVRAERIGWLDIPAGEEKPFDVIVLKLAGLPVHVGVVVRPGVMIHCLRGAGTVVEDYRSRKWKNQVEGFCRHADCPDDITAL